MNKNKKSTKKPLKHTKISELRNKSKSKFPFKKPEISKITRGNEPMFAGVAKKIITTSIIICVIIVSVCIIVNDYFSPDKVAKKQANFLVSDYYENYLYDRISESIDKDSDLTKTMEALEGTGLSEVTLKHLLSFDKGRNSALEKYFNTNSYYCDLTKSTAKIYPKAPYSRTDYTIELKLTCNFR